MGEIINLFPQTTVGGLGSLGSQFLGQVFGPVHYDPNTPAGFAERQLQHELARQTRNYSQVDALRNVFSLRQEDPWQQRYAESWEAYRKRLAKGILAGQIPATRVFEIYAAHEAQELERETAKHAVLTLPPKRREAER